MPAYWKRLRPRYCNGYAVGGGCPWCNELMTGHRFPTRDHLVPRSRLLHDRRIQPITVVVCRVCNHAKKNYTIEEWLDRLWAGNDPRAPLVSVWMQENWSLIARARLLLADSLVRP